MGKAIPPRMRASSEHTEHPEHAFPVAWLTARLLAMCVLLADGSGYKFCVATSAAVALAPIARRAFFRRPVVAAVPFVFTVAVAGLRSLLLPPSRAQTVAIARGASGMRAKAGSHEFERGDAEVEGPRRRSGVDLKLDVRRHARCGHESRPSARLPACGIERRPGDHATDGRQRRAVVHAGAVDDEPHTLRWQHPAHGVANACTIRRASAGDHRSHHLVEVHADASAPRGR
jgi:hypothetical protein